MTDADADADTGTDTDTAGLDFIRTIVEEHLASGRYDGRVVTRFPPEPNGLLHVGHAQAICLNFGIAEEYGGRCHLRFDDTNPLTEEESYAAAIRADIRWLGFDWGEHLYHASDYFERMYELAEKLIRDGKAYVDSQSTEEIRRNRGSLTEPGTPSPYRDRSVRENLDLFRRMRAGEFEGGEHVLRARIDMAHPNMIMRDPVFYRILHASHYRTGDEWCVYPLYDYAHCLEDAIEDVTHSICTLEFENNREIYDWILDETGFEEPRPHQYEFAGLDLEYTVLSKRLLRPLIEAGDVDGWDDPRMFTIAGIRRRGVPPEAVRRFCNEMVGVTKVQGRTDVAKFEWTVRDTLNTTAPRVMCVLRPLKLVLTNWPPGEGGDVGEGDATPPTEWIDAPHWPRDVDREGTRPVPVGRELWVERTDFSAEPPKGWRRLAPGASVRLRHAYVVTLDEVVTDDAGEPVELRCTCHTDSLGGSPEDVDVSGVVHWVSAEEGVPCTVRLYDRLFVDPEPMKFAREAGAEPGDLSPALNPDSLVVLEDAVVEPSVVDDPPDTRYQFERTGYFWRDPGPSPELAATGAAAAGSTDPDRPVFNRIVALRDTWKEGGGGPGRRGGREAREADEGREGREGREAQEGREGHEGHKKHKGREKGREGHEGHEKSREVGPEARISDARREARAADPELAARFERYRSELGLSLDDADVLTGSRALSDFFETALDEHDAPDDVAAWVVNEVAREIKERPVDELPFDGRALGRLAAMVAAGRVSRVAAKEVFTEMVASGTDPEEVIEARGLEKVDDPSALEPVIEGVLDEWPDKVTEYREGKTGLLGFFVGRVMRETGGAADPKLAGEMLAARLEEDR